MMLLHGFNIKKLYIFIQTCYPHPPHTKNCKSRWIAALFWQFKGFRVNLTNFNYNFCHKKEGNELNLAFHLCQSSLDISHLLLSSFRIFKLVFNNSYKYSILFDISDNNANIRNYYMYWNITCKFNLHQLQHSNDEPHLFSWPLNYLLYIVIHFN